MKKENTYFKNKMIVLYPFNVINFTPDGKHYTGFKFPSLQIRHLPYFQQTKQSEKPCKILERFFGDLLKKLLVIDKATQFGYSIHDYDAGNAEETISKVKEEIELLYYVIEKSNNRIGTEFPKYYLIKDITYFNDRTLKFYFSLYGEYIDNFIYDHISYYDNDIDKNSHIYFNLKTGNIYQPSIDQEWKVFLAQENIPSEIFWGVYWYNKAQDKTRDSVEKIVHLVISLENILDLDRPNEDNFTKDIINELELNRNDKRVCVFCSFIKQAHKMRSGIVHGGLRTSGFKFSLRGNYGGKEYFDLNFYLAEAFRLIIDKKVTGVPVSDYRKNYLLDRIYPNKAKLDDFWKIAKNRRQTENDIILTFQTLRGFKERENIGINNNLINKVVEYINAHSGKIIDASITLKLVAELIKDKNEWKHIRDLAAELDMKQMETLSLATIEKYKAREGLIDFLNFLDDYLMSKSIELSNKAISVVK